MRMMLVGAGAVGESILKVMQWRDRKGEWLKYVLVCDYDLKRAEEVVTMMKGIPVLKLLRSMRQIQRKWQK